MRMPPSLIELKKKEVLNSERYIYLVCRDPLGPPSGADHEVDIGHQLIVKHQGVSKSRVSFTNK